MKKSLVSVLVAFCVWQSLAFADDIDIYLRERPPGTAPYLMLMFDYVPNLASTFCNNDCSDALAGHPDLLRALAGIATDKDVDDMDDAEIRALMKNGKVDNLHAIMAVFQVVFAKFEGIYVGLMTSNRNSGGTILRGYKLFEAGDANQAKAELIAILKSIPADIKGSEDHNLSPNETHYELWSYLNGKPVARGHNTIGNFPAGLDTSVPLGLKPTSPSNPYYDSSIIANGDDATTNNDRYISPFNDPSTDYSCVRLYSVYATPGDNAGKDTGLDAEITRDMSRAATGSFDNMVSYLANNDLVDNAIAPGVQSMKTWFIQMGNGGYNRIQGWAQRSGTADQIMQVNDKVNLADVQATLESAFIEALSESSTFVSASVPVNVFNRIQTLDNFYIALFEANAEQRWPGNLKKLRLADTAGDGSYDDIVDVNGLSAFSDDDGRLRYEALTFWTEPLALPPANAEESEINGRDGRAVTRGGAGQKIPGFIGGSGTVGLSNGANTRQLFVEPSRSPSNGSAINFDPFNATTTTVSAIAANADELEKWFGTRSAEEARKMIEWARGYDVDNEYGKGSTAIRPWLLGDAIHSRPLALNYGATGGYTEDNPNIRLFMGTNSGFFHIFEDTTATGLQSGRELFAFIPRESLPILKELRTNDGTARHPYGVDGEPVALVVDHNHNGTIERGIAGQPDDEVYVYVGMRRGGKSYYALDVSDPNAVPKLQWKISKTEGGDFDELGMTFSTPRVAKVRYENTPRDVLIFAGGYDTNKDGTGMNTDGNSGPDSEGNAIYIVDARTGELIWKAVLGVNSNTNKTFYHSELTHSIPSAIATLDSNSNGVVDRAYVGDTGGVVWRIDLPEGTSENHRRDNWKITKLADFSGASEADDRRFFHPPDIVQTRDANAAYDGILIASGDRANPLETTVQNYLYLIKDRRTTSGNPSGTVLTSNDLLDTTACVDSDAQCAKSNDYTNGWKIQLNAEGDHAGEKGLASPLTADGHVYFTTYRPDAKLAGSCGPVEGMGALYIVNLKDGTAVFDNRSQEIGPGIPPQVTALDDTTIIIPGSGIPDSDDPDSNERYKLLETDGKGMYIIYWREPGVDKL